MRSDSVAAFLDLARENRLLGPDQFDDLFRQPDVPQSNLAALCDFLVARKVLTAYQAGMIRAGHGYELSFAGYPVHDDLGPCPGGTAYRVAHPSLRTPLVLRRLQADWLAPADNVAAFVRRAQVASVVLHPNLAPLLDAGVHRDEPFVVLEPTDGSDLDALITDIGPMPTPLAVEYIRQAARGLMAAHARELPHGDLRPRHLLVGPLVQSSRLRPDGTPRLRPSSTATVRVAEFGLIPRRTPGRDGNPYLPPERAATGTTTLAGDVFMLGGCLSYLLTGRPPGPGSLAVVRPDAPPAVAELVGRMMSADPAARPTVEAVLARLDALAGSPPAVPTPVPVDPPPEKLDVLLLEDNESEGGLPAEADPVVMMDGESGVALVSPAPPDTDPLAMPSGVSLTAPAAPAGWDAYSSRPVTPEAFPQPAAAPPPPWEPQPFVPSELDDDRTAPGYDPTADGVSRRRTPRPPDPTAKKKLWIWLGVGVGLWLLAIVLWVVLFMGGGEPEPEVKPKPVKKAPKKG